MRTVYLRWGSTAESCQGAGFTKTALRAAMVAGKRRCANVTDPNGYWSVWRLSAIEERLSEMHTQGIDGWVLRLLEFGPRSLGSNGGWSLVSLGMVPLASVESNKDCSGR